MRSAGKFLRRLYDQGSFLIICVPQETAVITLDFSVLETVLQAKFDFPAQRLAFLLRQARHDGKQHLTLRIHGVDVLFNDHISVSVHAALDHAVKFLTLFRFRSDDPVNGINPGQLPFRILLDKLHIMRHLNLIAGYLLFTVRGDPAARQRLSALVSVPLRQYFLPAFWLGSR